MFKIPPHKDQNAHPFPQSTPNYYFYFSKNCLQRRSRFFLSFGKYFKFLYGKLRINFKKPGKHSYP